MASYCGHDLCILDDFRLSIVFWMTLNSQLYFG